MQFLTRPLAWFMSAMLIIMPMAPLQAAMIGNEQIVTTAQSELTRDNVQQLMNEEAAKEQLQAMGVSPEWVQERINNLTDEELARINQEMDNLKAGGTSILGVLLVIFIVFIITDVIGATNIFPFVHPVR